jgi:GrpE.
MILEKTVGKGVHILSFEFKWLFGKKDKENTVENVMQEYFTLHTEKLHAELEELRQQLSKMVRLQYKSGQETQSTLEQLGEELKRFEQQRLDDKVALETLSDLVRQRESLVGALIRQLDDIDMVCDGRKEGTEDQWSPLLRHWSKRILRELGELDIREIDVLGKTFAPQTADCIGTIARVLPSEIDIPYEVASVVKRGFVDNDGVLLRKAQVITYQEVELA